METNQTIDITAEERETVLTLLQRHLPGVEAWAYGSRTKSTAHPQSDLDLVVFAPPEQSHKISDLREALEESNLSFRVDLFVWDEVPEQFHQEIKRDHVVLVGREKIIDGYWKKSVYGRITSDFCETLLSDLCCNNNGVQTGPFGSQLHKKDYVPIGTPIITVEHLGENRVIHRNLPNVSNNDKRRLSKYILHKGDIVFSRVGSVDRRALVRDAEDGWLFSGRCLRIRPDRHKIDSGYLSYFFGWESFGKHIRSIAVGATMPSLNTKLLSDISVPVPPLPEQRTIAHILGTLDDKIELNRRMNETLETMAQTLFKSWFVDFDPVRAKMTLKDHSPLEGESNPQNGFGGGNNDQATDPDLPPPHQSSPDGSPSATPPQGGSDWTVERARAYLDQMDPEIAALFPDRLVDSELGEIPEGWEVKMLGDCFHLTMGQSPPGSTYNDDRRGLPFFQGRTDFRFRYPENRKYCTVPTRIAERDDTLVSVRAPVGDINMAWEKCCAGRGVAALRHASGSRSFTYYSAWTIQQQLKQYEHTGTVFGAINKKQFEDLTVVEPTSEIVSLFESQVGPLDEHIRKGVAHSQTLTQARDTLLPKLISGEIRLPDMRKFTETSQ